MAGAHFWASVENKDSRVRLKGVYDLDEKRIEAAVERGRKNGVEIVGYSSRKELLCDPDIDIVCVATTNEVHAEICIDALRHSKHVICEKPVCLGSGELQDIIDVAIETGKLFTTHQNRRWDTDFLMTRTCLPGRA